MIAISPHFFTGRNILKPQLPRPPPLLLAVKMKDRPPPSSYVSVYVPPHLRLRSVITSSASSNTTSAAIDSKSSTATNGNSNHSTFVNSRAPCNPYPYLPQEKFQQLQQHQQKKTKSQYNSWCDEVSEEGSDREIEVSAHPGAPINDNIDEWRWKLTVLLRDKTKQEVISREKKDRRDYEQIASLASTMGLYSNLYVKVVVVSKDPLPNYRFDLDDKRPQREVILSSSLQRRVDEYLGDYMSHKPRIMGISSRSSSNGSMATDEGLLGQLEPLPHGKAMEKIIWRRSIQLRSEQQEWQV